MAKVHRERAPAPTKKNLLEWFPRELDAKTAASLAQLLKDAEGNHDAVDKALDLANGLLEMHGVEAIRGDYHVDNYYYDIVALCLNSGDAYTATILYDTDREKFYVWTYGDWVERNQRRYRII
jgi:hypothetical protein